MLMCKGKGCKWKKQCSRYVLGRGIAARTDVSVQWIDHCLRHHDKFVRIGNPDAARTIEESTGRCK